MGYTFSTDAPECPYCHKKQSHDGGFFYDEDLTECECDHCGKEFSVEVFTQTSWTCTQKSSPRETPNAA